MCALPSIPVLKIMENKCSRQKRRLRVSMLATGHLTSWESKRVHSRALNMHARDCLRRHPHVSHKHGCIQRCD